MDFYGNLSKKSQAGIAFTLTVFLMCFFSFIGQALLLSFCQTTDLVFVLINGLFSPLAILTVIIIDCRANKNTFKNQLSINKFNGLFVLCSLLLSSGMFLGLGFLNELVAKLLISWGLKVSAFNYNVTTIGEYLSLVLVYAILPSVFEEFLFRGEVLGKLSETSTIVSVVLSGLVFSLYHCSFAQTVYQFIYGVALAILVIKSKSILPAVLSHFLNNLMILTFNYLKINIDLFNPYLIIVGIALLCAFCVIICCINKKEVKNNGKFPFEFLGWASLGLAVCILTAGLGAIYG